MSRALHITRQSEDKVDAESLTSDTTGWKSVVPEELSNISCGMSELLEVLLRKAVTL